MNSIDRVLRPWLSSQVIQNFWRRRWEWRIGRQAFGCESLLKQATCLGFPKPRAKDQLSTGQRSCEVEFSLWKRLAELRACA